MRRAFYGSVSGLLLGLALAVGCDRYTGPDGFALRPSSIALGYVAALALGAVLGAALLGRIEGPRVIARRAALGAAVAGLATYVARGLPLPWLNLNAFDGGAGPAGEVPLVILPLLGVVLGVVLAADGGRRREDAAPPS